MAFALLIVFVMLFAIMLTACSREKLIIEPGSPVLMVKLRGTAEIAAYDGSDRTMKHMGTIDASELNGMTAVPFDWSVITDEEGSP